MRRPLDWIGSSLKDLKTFPKKVMQDIGFALLRVQEGDAPPQQSKLKGDGMAGVYEIEENAPGATYRAVYITTIGDVIYVLHAL